MKADRGERRRPKGHRHRGGILERAHTVVVTVGARKSVLDDCSVQCARKVQWDVTPGGGGRGNVGRVRVKRVARKHRARCQRYERRRHWGGHVGQRARRGCAHIAQAKVRGAAANGDNGRLRASRGKLQVRAVPQGSAQRAQQEDAGQRGNKGGRPVAGKQQHRFRYRYLLGSFMGMGGNAEKIASGADGYTSLQDPPPHFEARYAPQTAR